MTSSAAAMEETLTGDDWLQLEDGFSITEDELLEAIASSEGLNSRSKPKIVYTPLYKHPLPASDKRFLHEENLKQILSARVPLQGISAVAKGDAWTLEEVYMRHGMDAMKDRNGTTPLHLAVQMNNVDCCMVLVNIGVDLNAPNLLGYTPLYVADLNKFQEISKLLRDHNASLKSSKIAVNPGQSPLDVVPERRSEVPRGPASQHSEYYRVTNARQYF